MKPNVQQLTMRNVIPEDKLIEEDENQIKRIKKWRKLLDREKFNSWNK